MTAHSTDFENSSAVLVSDNEIGDKRRSMSMRNGTVTSTAPQQQEAVHEEPSEEPVDAPLTGANRASSELDKLGSGMLPGIPEGFLAPLPPSDNLHQRHTFVKPNRCSSDGEVPTLSGVRACCPCEL